MKKFLKDIFTGVDGVTYDTARVSLWFGIGCYVWITVYNSLHGKMVEDYLQWATGFSALVASVGLAIKLKQDTEPK